MREEILNWLKKRKTASNKELKELNRFIKDLKKRFSPLIVYLFGSRARGEELKSSDYDLLLLSPAFEKLGFRERIISAHSLLKTPVIAVDLICLTPKEFAEKRERYFFKQISKSLKQLF